MRWLCLVAAAGCYDLDRVPRPSEGADATTDGARDAAVPGDAGLDPYAASVLADTPIAYWRLGEATGGVAYDISGGGHDGTYQGTCNKDMPGIISTDRAVQFNGCYVNVPASAAFDFAEHAPFTLEFWLYRSGWPDNYAMILTRTEPTPAADAGADPVVQDGFYLIVWHDEATFVRVRTGGGESAFTNALGRDAWHHVVAVYDGMAVLGSLRVYVDGVLSPSSGTGNVGLLGVGQPLFIGDPRPATNPLLGTLDEVAIYDRALSLPTIQAHMGAR